MILVEKIPYEDWPVVENGAWGLLSGYYGKYLMFWGKGLEKNTEYVLIYYGYDEHNDEWPYATCIGIITTDNYGYTGSVSIKWDYKDFLYDDITQKFWLVKADDVDCENHRMVAWNPTEYLFEWDMI